MFRQEMRTALVAAVGPAALTAALLTGVLAPMVSPAQEPVDPRLTMKPALNLAAARAIAAAAEAEARANGWNVSIAIVDDAGRLLWFQRMDGSNNSSVDIAIAKAQHAVNYRRDTRFHQDLLEKGTNVVLALPASMPLDGGVRLMTRDQVIGGIGVSGVQASEDGQIARAGADWLKE